MSRVFSAILISFLAIGLLSCQQEDDGITKIRIWHNKDNAERAFLEEQVALYNSEFEHLEVEVLWRETEELRNLYVMAAVGGKGPDIIYGPADNIGVLELTETILPLDEVFPVDELTDFQEEGIVKAKGKTYMIADQIGSFLAFVYNKDLLPNPPASLEELVQLSPSFSKDTNNDGRTDEYLLTWNYTEPFFFIPFLSGFGGRVMDENGNPTLNTQATIDAIQFILDLRDKHQAIPREADYNTSEMLFKEGRAASIINGPWAYGGYGEAGVNYDIASIPLNEKIGAWCSPMVAPRGYSINVNISEDKLPMVKELIEFLTSARMQFELSSRYAIVPVRKSVLEMEGVKDNPLLHQAMTQIKRGIDMPTEPRMRQIWDGMRGPYQLVMNGQLTPVEGAKLMQEEVEKRIRDTYL